MLIARYIFTSIEQQGLNMLFVSRHSTRIKVLYPEPCGVELDPDVLWDQILDAIKVGSLLSRQLQ